MSLSIFLFVGEIFYRYLVDNERKKQTPKFRDSAGWTNKHSKLKKLSADFFLIHSAQDIALALIYDMVNQGRKHERMM